MTKDNLNIEDMNTMLNAMAERALFSSRVLSVMSSSEKIIA